MHHTGARRAIPAARLTAAVLSLLLTAAAGGARPAVSARASLMPQVRDAIARDHLTDALELARSECSSRPADPVAQQVRGVLLVANARIAEAEQAFAAAAAAGPGAAPVETGLEALAHRGTGLYEALYRQKVVFSVAAGGASVRNNLGATRILMNHAAAGLQDLDEAVRLREDWGAPWANAAVGWLERHRPDLAADRARGALQRGEVTAKTYTVLAEALYREKRHDEARVYLERAQMLEPHYAYALFVRSLLYRQLNRPRDSERALFQALALDPGVAAESRFVPARMQARVAGGSQSEDHQRLLASGRRATVSYRWLEERGGRDVEGADNAYQRRSNMEAIVGQLLRGGSVALYGGFLNESGGRPGMPSMDEDPAPLATFGFSRTDLAWLGRVDLSAASRLLFHAGYRHHGVAVRFAPAEPSLRAIRDEQVALEGRWDRAVGGNFDFTMGGAWLHNRRDTDALPAETRVPGPATMGIGPIEPNEQILPIGSSSMLTLYALGRLRPGSGWTVAAGPVYGRLAGSDFVLPYVDARRTLDARNTLRLALLPRMLDAGADLFPLEALPGPPQEDTLSRREDDIHPYDRNPLLGNVSARTLSGELSWIRAGAGADETRVTAFYRHFSDTNAITSDPLTACDLSYSRVPAGEARGIEVTHVQRLGEVGLYGFVRYQGTRLFRPDLLPGPMPEFPGWQAALRVQSPDRAGFTVGLEALYVGPHTGSRLDSYSSDRVHIGSATHLNLYANWQITPAWSLYLNVYNLTGSRGYYEDSQTGRLSVVAGLASGF